MFPKIKKDNYIHMKLTKGNPKTKDKKAKEKALSITQVITGLIVVTIGILTFVGFWGAKNEEQPEELPFWGECKYDTIHKSGKFSVDTIHHAIQNFSFINQEGKIVTQNNFKGKIYVTDFFFTTCQSICPIMTTQMERVVKAYKNSPEVLFLSHTVYPENDSVSVLSEYAKKLNADASRWYFVTGNKKELYDMARKSYFLSSDSGDGGKDDFVHTQLFALVDKNSHIRGVYDGTNPNEVDQLIADIGILLKK